MSLLSSASGASTWRGYDYYTEHKVLQLRRISDTQFEGTVSGSAQTPYTVVIDTAHLRKSTCNCPYASGKRIICKHMVATYFAAFPDEAKKFYQEQMAYQEAAEKQQEELYKRLTKYIHSLKKAELEEKLLDILNDGPEWQLDRFILNNLED